MKLLVLGAAGRVGGLSAKAALEKGHTVFACCRTPAKLSLPASDKLVPVKCDVLDKASVESAFATARADAVIIAVGANLKEVMPDDFFTRVTSNILSAARSTGTRRIVFLMGVQVKDDTDTTTPPFMFRLFGCLLPLLVPALGRAFKEGADQLRHMRATASDLDWTVVRPVAFKDGPSKLARGDPLAEMYAGPVGGVGGTIQCVDLAGWMVAQAEVREGQWKHKAPALSN